MVERAGAFYTTAVGAAVFPIPSERAGAFYTTAVGAAMFPIPSERAGADTGGCTYVKTRIENPGETGLYPQIAETGE
jgi:hypothetical protein